MASCRPSELADESERTSTDADGDDAEAEAEAEAVAAALAAEGAAEGESTDAASDMMVGDERPEAHRVFTRLEKALLFASNQAWFRTSPQIPKSVLSP